MSNNTQSTLAAVFRRVTLVFDLIPEAAWDSRFCKVVYGETQTVEIPVLALRLNPV
ncbi:MAG: hypothetical protein HRU33_19630 [Rhodobacteraceae bacterium]|nr:hypothetical protein [Paracoccaceae bacterium]